MIMEHAKSSGTLDWQSVLESQRAACENRLLPVMEQMNPKILLIMQQMSRHSESADLLTMITTDHELSLAQSVQILLNATSSPQTANGENI